MKHGRRRPPISTADKANLQRRNPDSFYLTVGVRFILFDKLELGVSFFLYHLFDDLHHLSCR